MAAVSLLAIPLNVRPLLSYPPHPFLNLHTSTQAPQTNPPHLVIFSKPAPAPSNNPTPTATSGDKPPNSAQPSPPTLPPPSPPPQTATSSTSPPAVPGPTEPALSGSSKASIPSSNSSPAASPSPKKDGHSTVLPVPTPLTRFMVSRTSDSFTKRRTRSTTLASPSQCYGTRNERR